jgi:hypothetical protein
MVLTILLWIRNRDFVVSDPHTLPTVPNTFFYLLELQTW